MKHHSYADLFPMMSDTEFNELCEDIAANGLKDPIITYHNQILDGRNRYKACVKTNTKPFFEEFRGTNAKAYVISKNLHRRHLDESQRAMLAAKLKGENVQICTKPEPKVSDAELAKTLNVSRRSVADAKTILSKGSPELVAEVEAGRTSVSKAIKQIKQPKVVSEAEQAESAFKVILKMLPKITREDLQLLGVKIADLLE